MIGWIAARLLWRHVRGSSAHCTGGSLGRRIHDADKSKVCHDSFHIFRQRSIEWNIVALLVQHDIAWFDIPMNDPLFVSVIESARKFNKQARYLLWWDTLFSLMQVAQVGCERGPPQVFHDNIRVAIERIKIVDLHNVGVPQPRHYFRLPAESLNQEGLFFNITVQ